MAAELIAKAIRVKPNLTLGLPTGNTPIGMYEDLVRAYREKNLDWSGVRTFNLDEYAGLGPEDPHSYRMYMQRHLFDHVNVSPRNIHFPVEGNAYEKEIREAGGIDLLIVGIGTNGHIAFNEPGASFTSRSREVILTAETIANAQQHFGSNTMPTRAVTMGIATLLDSRHIVLLASGASKADIIRRALNGPVTEAVPATVLQTHPNVIAILDEAAAAGSKF